MFGHEKQVSCLTVTLLSVSRGEQIKLASRAVILSNRVCEILMKKLEKVVLAYEFYSFNNLLIYFWFYLTFLLPLFSSKLQLRLQNALCLLQSVSFVLCSES